MLADRNTSDDCRRYARKSTSPRRYLWLPSRSKHQQKTESSRHKVRKTGWVDVWGSRLDHVELWPGISSAIVDFVCFDLRSEFRFHGIDGSGGSHFSLRAAAAFLLLDGFTSHNQDWTAVLRSRQELAPYDTAAKEDCIVHYSLDTRHERFQRALQGRQPRNLQRGKKHRDYWKKKHFISISQWKT